MEIIKYPKRQDCHYKLTPGSSNETSINLSYDIFYFLCPDGLSKGETRKLTFKIYRDDYIKALCYITCHLPYYITRSSNSTQVTYSYDLFAAELYSINSFFNGPVADYTVTLYYRNDGRIYLKDLGVNGFNIRKFLVEDKSMLTFSMEEKPVLRLSLSDSPVEEKRVELNTLEPTVEETPDTVVQVFEKTESLAVRDKVLKDFIYKVVLLINKSEGLTAFEPFINETSKSIQLFKKGSFRLTGMFISTSYSDMVKRNRLGIKPRWFDTPFILKGKTVYLSNQWYGKGNYTLMYEDFKTLIETCFGDKYFFAQNEAGEFELWKRSDSLEGINVIEDAILSKTLSLFQKLNTSKRNGKPAPHKAILLLSIMDLIEEGAIASPAITYSKELETAFAYNWSEYIGDDDTFKAVPETPFWHMNSEPFWTLQRSDGGDIFDIKNSPTSGQLKGYKIYAEISPEIYKLMTSEKNRIKLRQVLCDEYLNVQ